MVKIPRADSTLSLSTDVPSLQRPQSFGDRSTEIIGNALAEVGRKYNELRNLDETVEGTSQLNKRFFEIDKMAADDPDVWSLEQKYGPMYQKAAIETTGMISDPETRTRFKLEADQATLISQRSLREVARKKQGSVTRANVIVKNEEDKEQYFNTRDPGKRYWLKGNIYNRIAEAERIQAYDPEEAAKLRDSMDDELRLGQVRHDIAVDAAESLTNIRNADNPYKLTPEEKIDLEAEAVEMQKKQYEQQRLEIAIATGKKDQEIGQRIIEDAITQDELDDLFTLTRMGQPGGISQDLYEIGSKSIVSEKSVDPTLDGRTWMDLNEMYIDIVELQNEKKLGKKDTLELLATFRAKIVEARNIEGAITPENALKWFQATTPFYESAVEDQAKENYKLRFNKYVNAWHWANVFVDEFATEDDKNQLKANLGDELMSRIVFGQESADEVIEDIKKREQAKINPNRTAYPLKSEWEIAPGVRGTVIGYRSSDGEPIFYYEE